MRMIRMNLKVCEDHEDESEDHEDEYQSNVRIMRMNVRMMRMNTFGQFKAIIHEVEELKTKEISILCHISGQPTTVLPSTLSFSVASELCMENEHYMRLVYRSSFRIFCNTDWK